MAQTSTPMLSTPSVLPNVNDYRTRLASVLGQPPATTTPAIVPTVKTTSVVTPVVTPVVPTTSSVKTAPVVTPATTGGYSVKAGDSLGKIAQQNGMTLAQLLDLNPSYKANPNLVQVGANLNLSTSAPVTDPTKVTAPVSTVTPEQQAKLDTTTLAEKAGKAGYTPDQYNTLVQNQNTVTQAESDSIAKELGIPTVEGELFKKPTQTSQQLYQSAYDTSGLADLKKKIQDLNDSIAVDRANLTDAVGQIDENPFLTETSRVGRGKRILDQAEQKINNKLLQITQLQSTYDGGITEINNMVTRNQNDFNTDQTVNTAKLNYLQKKAEQKVSLLKDSKVKNGSDVSSYITGSTSTKSPTVIGNSESGFFKYDDTTGKFVQVVGQSTKSVADTKKAIADANNTNSGGSDFKPTADQKAVAGKFVNSSEGVKLGFTNADKARLNTDPNFFYWTLQKASEAGFY